MRSYCGQARAVLFLSFTNRRASFTGLDGALPIFVIYQPSSFVCSFMSYVQVPSSVFKAVWVSDYRIVCDLHTEILKINKSNDLSQRCQEHYERHREIAKFKTGNAAMHSKIRNTHEHHPFIYSYASYHVDMCPHLWAPSSAIYVYPAPGTEIVNFFCQGSRPKYDSPRG